MTRPDAAEKVRGSVGFGTDLHAEGMLWAALVPAPLPHGRLRGLDLDAARRSEGVVAAIGPEDLRGLLPKGGGDAERPVFPAEEIFYHYQPLAAVAAETLSQARVAAARVRVEAESLPPISDLDHVFAEWPSEDEAKRSPHLAAHVKARHGDTAAAFRQADIVHSETYRTSGVHQVALEPHACLARVSDGSWWVATSTQSPFGVREDAASILGIPEENLVVDGTWVGGGFGGKAAAFLEPYALVLSAAARRPVKLALTYREEFLLGRTTLPAVVRMDTALRHGRITGRRVRLILDGGASLPGRDFAVSYAIGFLLGPYRTDAFEVEGYAVRTNKPPFGPHRAPFAPQCAFVLESHLDGLARRAGVDPIEFRLQHVWREGETTGYGQPVGPFGLAACLERLRAVARRWRERLPPGHGIGVGCGFWSTNAQAGGEARLHLTERELAIVQGEREIGNGSVARGLIAVAERQLGIPADAIRVESRNTAEAPFDSGVFGSRTVAALGQAVQKAARRLAETLGERLGGTGSARLERERGVLVAVADGRRRPVGELFTAVERATGGLDAHGQHYANQGSLDESRVAEGDFSPYTDFTGAAHVAEVAVDRETGQVRVIRYAAFHDTGTVLDAAMFRGQVEGGVVMGLGAALTEEMLWAPDGRLENPGLLDYRIPTLGEVPPIEVHSVEGFLGAGPFGAKGLGEPPIVPVPAAVANGVADATGARVYEVPLTAERVARALKLL